MQARNEEIRKARDEAEQQFLLFEASGESLFHLLRANGETKRKIIGLIKQLKDVSRRIREAKGTYVQVRAKLEKAPRKLYKAVAGDVVDELLADYLNRVQCPVPIVRISSSQYHFGSKKIAAKVINGNLVIRVGGGYMGIEEFIMYYGQQELQKLQKEEQALDIMEDMTEEQIRLQMLHPTTLDVDKLQSRLKKQLSPRRSVLGIGDVRKAIKKSLVPAAKKS